MLIYSSATYDYDLYFQLACLWVWLILIIINDPIGHNYYISMYMLDVIYQDGNTELLSSH